MVLKSVTYCHFQIDRRMEGRTQLYNMVDFFFLYIMLFAFKRGDLVFRLMLTQKA